MNLTLLSSSIKRLGLKSWVSRIVYALVYSGKSGRFGLLANDWYDRTTHGKSRSHRTTLAERHRHHPAVSESLSLPKPYFPVTGERSVGDRNALDKSC
jgi:hypothetical protein